MVSILTTPPHVLFLYLQKVPSRTKNLVLSRVTISNKSSHHDHDTQWSTWRSWSPVSLSTESPKQSLMTAGSPGQHIILTGLMPYALAPSSPKSWTQHAQSDTIQLSGCYPTNRSIASHWSTVSTRLRYQDCLPSVLLMIQTRTSHLVISIFHGWMSRLFSCQRTLYHNLGPSRHPLSTLISAQYTWKQAKFRSVCPYSFSP